MSISVSIYELKINIAVNSVKKKKIYIIINQKKKKKNIHTLILISVQHYKKPKWSKWWIKINK